MLYFFVLPLYLAPQRKRKNVWTFFKHRKFHYRRVQLLKKDEKLSPPHLFTTCTHTYFSLFLFFSRRRAMREKHLYKDLPLSPLFFPQSFCMVSLKRGRKRTLHGGGSKTKKLLLNYFLKAKSIGLCGNPRGCFHPEVFFISRRNLPLPF